MTRYLLVYPLALLACLIVSTWALLALITAGVMRSSRTRRLLVAFDQLGNTAAGGDEDETFSARCWRNRERAPYGRLVTFIDWLFLRLTSESGHCEKAYERERV